MANTEKLEAAIKRAGFQKKDLAKKLGLSAFGLQQKINNVREFKASEITALYDLLKLSSLEEQQQIFLTNL